MAAKAKMRPHPVGIPEPGTYVVDCDRRELFRIEAIHRHKGVVLENARSCVLFMLTAKEYLDQGFREI